MIGNKFIILVDFLPALDDRVLTSAFDTLFGLVSVIHNKVMRFWEDIVRSLLHYAFGK